MPVIIFIVVLVVFVLIILSQGVRIVNQQQVMIIEKLGRYAAFKIVRINLISLFYSWTSDEMSKKDEDTEIVESEITKLRWPKDR